MVKKDSLLGLLDSFWSYNSSDQSNIQSFLKEVKRIIKGWAVNLKDKTERRIEELERTMDKDSEICVNNVSVIVNRKELEHLYDFRDDMLRQKARLDWQIQGDRNSKFFHQAIQRGEGEIRFTRFSVAQNWFLILVKSRMLSISILKIGLTKRIKLEFLTLVCW